MNKVKRIVTNISTENIQQSTLFYGEILGLDVLMDHGWIKTYGNNNQMQVQISVATEGGNGTPVPELSIEVEAIGELYEQMKTAGFEIVYPFTEEEWGVKRFFVKDPFGKIVNILQHI